MAYNVTSMEEYKITKFLKDRESHHIVVHKVPQPVNGIDIKYSVQCLKCNRWEVFHLVSHYDEYEYLFKFLDWFCKEHSHKEFVRKPVKNSLYSFSQDSIVGADMPYDIKLVDKVTEQSNKEIEYIPINPVSPYSTSPNSTVPYSTSYDYAIKTYKYNTDYNPESVSVTFKKSEELVKEQLPEVKGRRFRDKK